MSGVFLGELIGVEGMESSLAPAAGVSLVLAEVVTFVVAEAVTFVAAEAVTFVVATTVEFDNDRVRLLLVSGLLQPAVATFAGGGDNNVNDVPLSLSSLSDK